MTLVSYKLNQWKSKQFKWFWIKSEKMTAQLLPLETEFNCKYRKPSVTSFERSLIGLKNDLCNSSGRLSPRINLQWFTKSAAVCKPFGISTSSSCESMLLIFGAELNDPILKNIHEKTQAKMVKRTVLAKLTVQFKFVLKIFWIPLKKTFQNPIE